MKFKIFTLLISLTFFNTNAWAGWYWPHDRYNRPGCLYELAEPGAWKGYYGACVDKSNDNEKIKLRVKNCDKQTCYDDDIDFDLGHGECKVVLEKAIWFPGFFRYCARYALPETKISNLSPEAIEQLNREKINIDGSYTSYDPDPAGGNANSTDLKLCVYWARHNRLDKFYFKNGEKLDYHAYMQDRRINAFGLFDETKNFQPFHVTEPGKNSRVKQFAEYLKKNRWLYEVDNNKDKDKAKQQIINWWNKTTEIKMPDSWARAFANKIVDSVENSAQKWPGVFDINVVFGEKIIARSSSIINSSKDEAGENIGVKIQTEDDEGARDAYIKSKGGINKLLEDYLDRNGISSETSTLLNCVNVSARGPIPPPYPDKLVYNPALDITVSQICPLNENGIEDKEATESDGCIISDDVINNFIHNSVRVSQDNYIPSCETLKKNNPKIYEPLTDKPNDKCVFLKNTNIVKNIITPCRLNDSDICYESNDEIKFFNNQARLIYVNPNDDSNSITEYIDPKDTICPPGISSNCKKIWGVNVGYYADLTIDFRKDKIENNQIKSEVKELNGIKLQARIGAKASNTKKTDATRSQICVYNVTDSYQDKILKCVKRPTPIPAKITNCTQNQCISNYFSPAAYITLSATKDKEIYTVEGVAKTEYFSSDESPQAALNLAGYDYALSILDENYLEDQVILVDPNTPPYEYNKQIMYKDGLYLMGGRYMCLGSKNLGNYISTNTENTVLTKIRKLDGLEFNIEDLTKVLIPNKEERANGGQDYSRYCNAKPSNTAITKIVPYVLKVTKDNNVNNIKVYKEELLYNNSNTTISCYTHDYKKNGKDVIKPLYLISQDPTDVIDTSNTDQIEQECLNKEKLNQEIATVTKACKNLSKYNEATHNSCEDFDDIAEPDCKLSNSKKLDFIKLQKCDNNKYAYKISTNNYDKNKCTIRNKNPVEENKCLEIDQPKKCEATTESNATWTEAEFGEYSQGTCLQGYEAKDPSLLTRLCTIYYSPPNHPQHPAGILKTIDKEVCTLKAPPKKDDDKTK